MLRQRVIVALVMGALGAHPQPAAADGAPVIEHVEPTSGPPGTQVHIVGRRFGQSATVTLGGQPVPVESSLPNRLTVRVPRGAASGRVEVQSRTGRATGPEYRVTEPLPAPRIESIEPLSGPPGTRVRIRGRHFSPRLTGNQVSFGAQPAVVRNATPVELEVIVPAIDQPAPIRVRVAQAGEIEGKTPFHVTPATAIEGFEPKRAPPGSEVVIRGHGFSERPRQNRVFLNSVRLRVKSADPQRLVVRLPREIASGKLLVDVEGAGRAYSEQAFEVQRQPTIHSVAPSRAAAGALVTLHGTNFGDDPSVVEVMLNDVAVPVRDAQPTALTVEVPEKAQSGPLRVRVHGVGPAESKQPLEVVPVLRITGFSPRSGVAGSLVTLRGQGFATEPEQNRVTLGGRRARVLKAAADQLKFRVPAGPSGPIEVVVPGGGHAATVDPFVVRVPPQVNEVSPRNGPIGSELRIKGKGFGHSAAALKVKLGAHPLEVRSVRDDLVVARVTPGAKTARVKVALPLQGAGESEAEFEVLGSLRVSEVEPQRARPGDSLTVRGHGFLPGATSVELGGKSLAVEVLDGRTLSIKVPAGAESGALVVRLPDGRSARAPERIEIAAQQP